MKIAATLLLALSACSPNPSEKAKRLYEHRQGQQQYDRESILSESGEPDEESKSAQSGPPAHYEPERK